MHYLRTGCWVFEGMSPNLVREFTFGGWDSFFNYSINYFSLLCAFVENHYYYDTCQNNSLTIFVKLGAKHPFRGHFLPSSAFPNSTNTIPLISSIPTLPFLWTYTSWSDMIRYHMHNLYQNHSLLSSILAYGDTGLNESEFVRFL
jgi:hypothetical protein